MNEITSMHNDLIDVPLRNFTKSEIDLLLTICHDVKDKWSDEVIISFDRIKQLADYKNTTNNEQFYRDLKKTNDKLLGLTTGYEDEHIILSFALFPMYEINKDEGYLRVRVATEYLHFFNNLQCNYTSLELSESNSLNSIYSKQIYKKLRQFRIGKASELKAFWNVSIEEFREYLNIPKSYKMNRINDRVIEPALKELSPYFENLECEKIYQKKGKGRPRVAFLEWSFKKQPTITRQREIEYENKLEELHNTDIDATIEDWQQQKSAIRN